MATYFDLSSLDQYDAIPFQYLADILGDSFTTQSKQSFNTVDELVVHCNRLENATPAGSGINIAFVGVGGYPIDPAVAQVQLNPFDAVFTNSETLAAALRESIRNVRVLPLPVPALEWTEPPTSGFTVSTIVAANSPEAQTSRLLKAFRRFRQASATCTACGEVYFLEDNTTADVCTACGGKNFMTLPPKHDARLRIMTSHHDHNLRGQIHRLELDGVVFVATMPFFPAYKDLCMWIEGTDVYTTPAGGGLWGQDAMAAFAAGLPILVPEYGIYFDLCHKHAEFISVSDYVTEVTCGYEIGLVDLEDYVLKLDRLYMEPEQFAAKWGQRLGVPGMDRIACGRNFRDTQMRSASRLRSVDFTSTDDVRRVWREALDDVRGLVNKV